MEPNVPDPPFPVTKFKKDEWIYTYLGRVPSPFKCKVVRIVMEEYGVFTKKLRPVYHLQIPEQEWMFARYEFEIARTQSALNAGY